LITYYIVIFSMPYMNHYIWNAEFGPGLTVTKLAGAVCLLYALIYLASRHAIPRFFVSPQSKWMMLFFGFAAFSFVSKGHSTMAQSVNPAYMYASSLIFFFITMTVIDSIKRLYWSLMMGIGSAAFASLYMLKEWQHGTSVWGAGYRPGWIVGDSNYFTVAALSVLPVAFELFLVTKIKWHRIYCIVCMLLVFAAVTLGASRGGFLGILVDVIYLIIRSKRPMRNLMGVLLLTIPFLIFAPNSPLHRFFSPQAGDTASVEKHLVGWQAGLNMVKKNPLTGVGLGNYKSVVTEYDTTGTVRQDPHIAHNAYLEIAAEMGIPAFLVYLIFLGTTLYSIGVTRKRALARGSEMLAALALGMEASVLGAAVSIFFVSGEYTRLFWFILCLSMALPLLVPARKQVVAPPPPEKPVELEPEPGLKIGEALVEMR